MYAYLHETLCDYVDDECKNCKRTSTGGERDSPLSWTHQPRRCLNTAIGSPELNYCRL